MLPTTPSSISVFEVPMKSSVITTVVFCALIGGLTIASLAAPTKEMSETENRSLAQLPKFSLESLFSGDFTSGYEDFITDQFIARDSWIAVKSTAERLLGRRESNGVYLADDDYFIDGTIPDSEQSMKNLEILTDFANDVSEKYNLRIMIAPTASLILSDKLPYGATVWDQSSYLDEISRLPGAIDVRAELSEHSDEYIYYRTDHHWTADGMYIAYRSLCESLGLEPIAQDELVRTTLSDDFLGTVIAKVGIESEPDTMIDLTSSDQPNIHVVYGNGISESDSLYVEEKLETRDKYGVYLGGNPSIADITTSVKNGKTLVLAKDSYAHCMLPLLANHYERLIVIDLRSFNKGFSTYLDELTASGVSISDVVVLYSSSGFANDRSVIWLKK